MKIKNKFNFNIVKIIPLLIMMVSFIFFTINSKNVSITDILNFTPQNHILAGLIVVVIYAVKSISMFVSLSILYISVGVIFPSFEAIFINLIGLIVTMVLPFLIGKLSGKGLFYKVAERYPKIERMNNMEKK